MPRCSNCDHPNDEGAVFCAACNHFLEWEAGTGTSGEPARVRRSPDSDPPGPRPSPAAPTSGTKTGTPVTDLVAALDSGTQLAATRGRSDLVTRLVAAREMAENQEFTVAVVGEFKRGKSTLINALLQTAACPVDADVVTAVPMLLRYGKHFEVLAHIQGVDDAEETIERVDPADLTALVSDQAHAHTGDVRSVEVLLPHRMLRTGLRLRDTPGVGGLESMHGQLSLAGLNGVDGALFVTDASQELTAPELAYLTTAVERCSQTALVVTKTDLHQHWRTIVAADQQHLDAAALDVPIIPVSSFLRLRASQRPQLNDESGFAPLVEFLGRDVVRRAATRGAARLAHEVDFAATQLTHEADAERVVLARPAEGKDVVGRLDQVSRRAAALTAPTAPWQQILADGIQDLVSDVEHDLASRLRTVLRDVRDIIDESDPRDSWTDTQNWLRAQVAEAGMANRDLLLRRANELSDTVAGQFEVESSDGVEVEFDEVGRALADLQLPTASTLSMPGGRLGSVLTSGRLAAYVPLMALGVAVHTTLLIVPPAALIGAVLGRKLLQMEGRRQTAYRQGQAKAAAAKFVDEVAFEMNKDTRDGLRRTQRRLRDEFQARAGSIQTSASAALVAARRAASLAPDVQMVRAAEVDQETTELAAIRGRMLALAGAGDG